MPKSTQMHVQWITVNGQSVPLVLPQYWDGEKWVISSEQNPLPVKAELTGSSVGYSGDTKPTGKKGETFLELDTLDVYVYDGTEWVKIT